MSLNKGKAKAKPSKKTTAKTAGTKKKTVMNRRKYNEAISGDTMSNYAMYKRGGKVKKYRAGKQVADKETQEKETYADRIVNSIAKDDSVLGNYVIKPVANAFLTGVENAGKAVKKYGSRFLEAASNMERGSKINRKGGTIKNKKFAALAPPYDKVTFADKIAGAKKRSKKK